MRFSGTIAGVRRRLRERMAAWSWRRLGQDTPPFTLSRRRLYILPTRAGVGFALLLLVMLVAGLNYGNSVALFLTFLLGGFVLVTMHQCHRNLLGLAVLDAAALPTFAGQSGSLSLILENPASLARFRIEASIPDGSSAMTDLAPAAKQRVELAVPAPTRGVIRIERLQLTTTHPFGLFRTWTWVHTPVEMIVYPRPHGTRPMPSEADRSPGARSRGSGGSDEWLGLRPFRDGDSPRQVAWKAYARGTALLVKEYSSAGSELRIFDIDRLTSLDTEARLEQLARWIVDAEARGERYGLVLPGVRIEPDHGPEHRHRCLTALALHGLEDRVAWRK